MSVLLIGPAESQAIEAALKAARAQPTPWAALQPVADETETRELLLRDRKPGAANVRKAYPPVHVMLGSYRTALSFEEQPAGMMRHLSVSSANPVAVPGPEVMSMVCTAFGFSDELCAALGQSKPSFYTSDRAARIWVEEFEPGRMAINVIEVEA